MWAAQQGRQPGAPVDDQKERNTMDDLLLLLRVTANHNQTLISTSGARAPYSSLVP